MKRAIAFILVLFLFISSANASSFSIPRLTDHIMKYNAAASVIGAKQIDEKNVIDQDGVKCFDLGTYLIGFSLDENEEISECAVLTTKNTDDGEFLLTCMSVMLFLGDMDYEAFGHLLHQYSSAVKGEKPQFFMIGIDLFNITVNGDGSFLFVYTNSDRSYWF